MLASNIALARWTDAERILRERAESEPSELVDWETYLLAISAVLAWEKDDPGALMPPNDAGKDSEDTVVAGWWLMHDAVRTTYDADVTAGAQKAAAALEQIARIGVANEDVPLSYALAADMLLEAGDHAALERVTAPLAALPLGPRFKLLHAQLLRVQALLSTDPVDGLRQSVQVLDGMGATFWAARVRVDLATALADSGDQLGAAAALDAADPVLRSLGAGRALRKVDQLRAREGLRQASVPRQLEPSP